MAKGTFQSKTIWLNLIALAVSGLTMINPELLAGFGVPEHITPVIVAGIGTVVAGLNLILRRFFTTQTLK